MSDAPPTGNAALPTENMEVHHHAHSPRKRFKHYLFEFFMLFLAVTLGFFVENEREHLVEHRREQQYIQSLLEDLKMDTQNLSSSIAYWGYVATTIDSLHKFARVPVKKENLPFLYKLSSSLMNFDNFIYNDRTIEQLRSSGNFRLIRNSQISDSIIQYDGFIRSQLREQEKFQLNMFGNLMSLQHELFDSEVMRSAMKNRQMLDSFYLDKRYHIEPLLNNEEKIFKYSNEVFLYQVGAMLISKAERNLKHRAAGLIQLMEEKYHLNN